MRRPRQWTQRGDGGLWPTIAYCVCAVYLNCVVSLLVWIAFPALAGLQPVMIVSGSMAPAVDAGDVVLMSSPTRERVKPGAVVLFADPAHPGRRLTHRVVTQSRDGHLTTKGDANASPDSTAITVAAVEGVGRMLIPAVGAPALWLRGGQWGPLAAWVAATGLSLAVVLRGRTGPPFHRWSSPLRLPEPAALATDGAAAPGGARALWWEPAPQVSRRVPRWATVALTAVAVAGLVVPRVVSAQSAFADAARNRGNDFAASTSFCTAPGTQTVMAAADAKVDEFRATTNYGTTTDLVVQSRANKNVRSLLRFNLPAVPAGCAVTAKLRLYASAVTANRMLEAWAAGGAWTETGVTWATVPAASGTPSALASLSTAGWMDFAVSEQVKAMYAGANNGFVVRDKTEGGSTTDVQTFSSREAATNQPQLVITFATAPGSRPPAPSGLTATTLSASRVGLAWTDNATDETSYSVQRSPGGSDSWTTVATLGAGATTYTDTALESATTYDYRVRAVNAAGPSAASNVASAKTHDSPPPPAAPTALTASAAGVDTVQLTWTDNAVNEEGFRIERSPSGQQTWSVVGTVGVDVTTFASTGLLADTGYDHRVRAFNNGGPSEWSNVATATTATCATLAARTLTAAADTLLLQGAGGDTNYGSDAVNFGIRSLDASNGRSLINFGTPATPGGCAITSATLRVYEKSGDVGRTINALTVAASWKESVVTWNTRPATSGTAVSSVSAVGWNAWDVTALVGAAGTGVPHGFLLRDAAENNGTALRQYYSPREGADPPQLVVRYN